MRMRLEDVEPTVLRRIGVAAAMRLGRLHLVLRAAMPWQNHHLWAVEAGCIRWDVPNHRHLYPCLADIEGRCPPEDVGGFPG